MSRRDFYEEEKKKKIITRVSLVTGLIIVAFLTTWVTYSKKLNDKTKSYAIVEEDNTVVPNNELEPTSFSSDKTVENVNYENTVKVELENTTNSLENAISKETVSSVVAEKDVVEENKTDENVVEEANAETEIQAKDLSFQAPVAGDIIKDYAMDTLVYSETLEEWCTHPGIDIKADKTTVVQASGDGIVESIKNDPRYGLTVIISHQDGFKTVYSNLLTTEFVQEGEEVEKGQTIATVGNSASFEAADESHLHFEMYKDGEAVNPTIYFK